MHHSPETPADSTNDQPQQWRLWRQDDAGNPFPMDALYDSPEAADVARDEFTTRAHKQYYYVRPHPLPEGSED
jgi:hypothetical protein